MFLSSIPVTAMRTGVSGFRSSWLSTARNWSFARFAASADSFDALSSISARRRSATSRKQRTTPVIAPFVSRIGRTAVLDGCSVPSLATSIA